MKKDNVAASFGQYLSVFRGDGPTTPDDASLGKVLNCPVFVINLERSVARREFIVKYLRARGIEPRLFAAIDGSKLDLAALAQDGIYDDALAKAKFSRSLAPGEIGTTMSHLGIHRLIVSEGIPMALVLEDDIMMIDGVAAKARAVVAELPAGWDLLQFYYWCHDTEAVSPNVVRFKGEKCLPVGALGYLITRAGAAKMLEASYPICYPADSLLGRSSRWGVTLYGSVPPVITLGGNHVFPTEIHLKRGGLARIRYLLKHLIVRTTNAVFSK